MPKRILYDRFRRQPDARTRHARAPRTGRINPRRPIGRTLVLVDRRSITREHRATPDGKRPLEHARFRRIESVSPRNNVHHFRLTALSDIDAEFHRWLAEAYAVGEQKHLRAGGA